MRYFFELRDGSTAVPDDQGIELASREFAEEEAIALLLEVGLERRRKAPVELFVQLRDENGVTRHLSMVISESVLSVS